MREVTSALRPGSSARRRTRRQPGGRGRRFAALARSSHLLRQRQDPTSLIASPILALLVCTGCLGPRSLGSRPQAIDPPAAPHHDQAGPSDAHSAPLPEVLSGFEPEPTIHGLFGDSDAPLTADAGDWPLPDIPSRDGGDAIDDSSSLALLLQDLPAPRRHFVDLSNADYRLSKARDQAEHVIAREREESIWFAALIGTSRDGIPYIRKTFADRAAVNRFAAHPNTIIESWTYRAGNDGAPGIGEIEGRRLRASEASTLALADEMPPTFQTVAYVDPASGDFRRDRLVYARNAAESSLSRSVAYQTHQAILAAGRSILHARNSGDLLDADAQWAALSKARSGGRFPVAYPPRPPAEATDLFLAIEYESSSQGFIKRPLRLLRQGEIAAVMVDGVKALSLRVEGEDSARHAFAFERSADGVSLHPAPHPLPGREAVEMRVADTSIADPMEWNLVDFGIPHVVRERALADLGLVQGHLERKQKARAVRKSGLDLFAEPLIAGLNIGGGLAAVDAPIGDGLRFLYNALIVPGLLGRNPAPDDYPALLRDLAATETGRIDGASEGFQPYLEPEDVTTLSAALRPTNRVDIDNTLRLLGRPDYEASARLARRRNTDERYRWAVDSLTDLLKVTEASESGVLKSIFNNSRLSPNGELSLKNTLAVAAGREDLTPLSGVSLDSLASGDGPSSAWWQYLDFSIDLRAVANSVGLWFRRGRADRELHRPFPHGMLVSDLAAYEVRLFGFPTLLFHKRRMALEDAAAFNEDYAYGVVGATIVERFPSQEGFEAELVAGRMVPLGFVQAKDAHGRDWPTNLPVFGHRIASGDRCGQTSLILYGLKAFHAHAGLMERELARVARYEAALQQGGVIEQLVVSETQVPPLGATEYEPTIHVGEDAVRERYYGMLDLLLECDRYSRLTRWGAKIESGEQREFAALIRRLQAEEVSIPGDDGSPLIRFDPGINRFEFWTTTRSGPWARMVTLIPSKSMMERELRNARLARQIENARRDILLHQ